MVEDLVPQLVKHLHAFCPRVPFDLGSHEGVNYLKSSLQALQVALAEVRIQLDFRPFQGNLRTGDVVKIREYVEVLILILEVSLVFLEVSLEVGLPLHVKFNYLTLVLQHRVCRHFLKSYLRLALLVELTLFFELVVDRCDLG